MTFFTILKIIGIVLGASSGTGLIAWIIGRGKLKKTHKEEIEKLNHKLAEEIRRNNEKQKQVNDLLEFQSNDSKIKNDMETSVEKLKESRSNASVKKEFIKISANIRDIYNSR